MLFSWIIFELNSSLDKNTPDKVRSMVRVNGIFCFCFIIFAFSLSSIKVDPLFFVISCQTFTGKVNWIFKFIDELVEAQIAAAEDLLRHDKV